jgi:hypothetical protein
VAELWALLHFLNPDQFVDPVAVEDGFSFSALGNEERVAELHNILRPYFIRRQDRCRRVVPAENLQRVAGWNSFFATAALLVVVDEDTLQNLTQARAGRIWVRNNFTKPYYYGAENVLQPLFSFRKC